ncbi:hypothetical protein EPUS_05360 [Endocarpon pusillum Z07020]|uniref:Acyl-CoA thioesterase II n=1 Tax=Endocarpon pusillum (strain Z07020 / HMAS-L-300199) TaxID=1263415 RepID=U1G8Y7_ENDPU|nr:uncharacterized protein EPUS_05360 [Endocarpon pusillum Z07020]ERF73937.1 hypothetical protein EPUS_05360 [Endocarpon pusillum Z07020]
MAATIHDMIRLKRTNKNTLESLALPERMDNRARIAFGGCALSMTVSAAFQTVESPLRGRMALYSVLGHFLGPTVIDRAVFLRVTALRDTRTFATRQVIAFQKQDDGKERACISAQLDFIVSPTDDPSIHSFLQYSVSPPQTVNPEALPSYSEALRDRVIDGGLDPNVEKAYTTNFRLFETLFEYRVPRDAPLSENVMGIDKTRKTSQDHLPLTSKRHLDYFRIRQNTSSTFSPPDPDALPISSTCLHFAALAFAMDGAIAFIPLSLSHNFLPDVAACSSLDFALRFHTDVMDAGKWHLREIRTVVGDYGRTYNEARLWNEEGRLVATMNQQDILRPHSGPDERRRGEAKL